MRPDLTPSSVSAARLSRVRRWAAALGAVVAIGLSTVAAPPASALLSPTAATEHPGQVVSTTSTSEALAGTTLEADSRDDGTALAPWLIWSGIAAGASVLVGGLLLKRRMT